MAGSYGAGLDRAAAKESRLSHGWDGLEILHEENLSDARYTPMFQDELDPTQQMFVIRPTQ